MPKYDVDVRGTLEISTCLNVSAKNEEDAEEKALASMQQIVVEWTITDNNKKPVGGDWQEDNLEWDIDSVRAEE